MMRWIDRLAKWTALFGGLILVALTLMVVVSVSGRALNLVGLDPMPVPGDFELVEVGIGVAIFCFMPWCFLRNGHATVDLLYMHMPNWFKRGIDIFSDIVMMAVWLVLTWKLYEGTVEKKQYLETTFILQMPLWWAYSACFVGAVIGCVAYVAKALTHLGLFTAPPEWLAHGDGAH